jgi:hypothetical protein
VPKTLPPEELAEPASPAAARPASHPGTPLGGFAKVEPTTLDAPLEGAAEIPATVPVDGPMRGPGGTQAASPIAEESRAAAPRPGGTDVGSAPFEVPRQATVGEPAAMPPRAYQAPSAYRPEPRAAAEPAGVRWPIILVVAGLVTSTVLGGVYFATQYKRDRGGDDDVASNEPPPPVVLTQAPTTTEPPRTTEPPIATTTTPLPTSTATSTRPSTRPTTAATSTTTTTATSTTTAQTSTTTTTSTRPGKIPPFVFPSVFPSFFPPLQPPGTRPTETSTTPAPSGNATTTSTPSGRRPPIIIIRPKKTN